MPIGKLDKIDLGAANDAGTRIIIWAANQSEAKALDDALYPLLIEYGYDVLSSRREFPGGWFISYHSSKKTPGFEKDFSFFAGSDPRNPGQPGAQLPPENPEKWKGLKDALETVKSFLVVGTLLVGSIAALHEFNEAVHKQFQHTPAPTLSAPAPQIKQLQKISLPPTLIRIDAEKNTRLFETTLNTHVEVNLTSRGFLKRKQSGTDTQHLKH